ncbi:MAG: hypothetical protein ACTHL8_20565 [Burkholderiaceae bacterium]
MLNKDFKEFVGLLDSTNVEYLLVGGYALAAHGHPRYTGDIDFWVNPTPENVVRLMQALTAFGFGGLGLTRDDFMQPDAVVQLGYPPARIDLLTAIDGVSFDACYARRRRLRVDGVELSLIDVDDLRANKRASGRLKDLADLEALDAAPDDPADD